LASFTEADMVSGVFVFLGLRGGGGGAHTCAKKLSVTEKLFNVEADRKAKGKRVYLTAVTS